MPAEHTSVTNKQRYVSFYNDRLTGEGMTVTSNMEKQGSRRTKLSDNGKSFALLHFRPTFSIMMKKHVMMG